MMEKKVSIHFADLTDHSNDYATHFRRIMTRWVFPLLTIYLFITIL